MKKNNKEQKIISDFFWKNDANLKKLNILNDSDFKKPELKLGTALPKNLGINDLEETKARNSMMRFLSNNPKFRDGINELISDYHGATLSLPTNGNDFLLFYEQENVYWQAFDKFLNRPELQNENCPKRLREFAQYLKTTDSLRLAEQEMGARISKELRKVTTMEGVFNFNLDMELSDHDTNHTIIGQRSFSSAWSYKYTANIPSWAESWFSKVTGIKTLVQKIANAAAERKSKRSALILDMPNSLKQDIINGVLNLINPKYREIRRSSNDLSKLTGKEKDMKKSIKSIPDIDIMIHFEYGEKGLIINILSIKAHDYRQAYFTTSVGQYSGYTEKETETIESRLEEMKLKATEAMAMQKASETIAMFAKKFNIHLNTNYSIPALSTNFEFQWNFLDNIYSMDENIKIWERLNEHRQMFWHRMVELKNLHEVLAGFEKIAEKDKIPLCIPTIITGKSGITFKNLAPIDMLGQERKMVPFSFPKINGQMICLTGRHGRGKSVAGNSVLQSLWLAQSGLPVFAESFEFDLKDVIGAVTNDHGEGSTATVFIQKTKNLLKNIAKVPVEKSLIFIDEIGKGTQENAGLMLGKRLLGALAGKKYSVIFNTQIMALAQYAQDNLEAKCLKVDKNHQFTPGIGEGEMEELIKEIGLEKYLK